MDPRQARLALDVARALQGAANEHARAPAVRDVESPLSLFDALVDDPELVEACRSLFASGHYAQAVEEAYKFLNNLVKRRTGIEADGAGLMTTAFSPTRPRLKLNKLTTQSQRDQQLGYMQIYAGAMSGIRNPRAHEHRYLDAPRNAVELIALCNHLTRVVRQATRARRRPPPADT